MKAHFDGRVLVPDEPVQLAVGQSLEIQVTTSEAPVFPKQVVKHPLAELARLVKQLPEDPNAPTDGSMNHDHYLYGAPKHQ